MNIHLSRVGEKMSRLTGVRAIMKDIQETLRSNPGRNWLNLSAGNPVILPEIEEMWGRHTHELLQGREFGEIVCRYGSSQGYEPLLDAITDSFNGAYGWGIGRRNILITPGSQTLYFFALNALAGTGRDEKSRSVVLPLCPEYTGYSGAVLQESSLKTYKPLIDIVAPHRFKYRVDSGALQFDDSVGAVLFSRPCNPTGNVLSDSEVTTIVDGAADHDIPVLIDSAYAPPFPDMAFTEMNHIWRENVIFCASLSKAGLPGERVGIAIGDERYIALLESFQSNANLHSSRFGQAIAAKAIASGELAHLSSTVIKPHYQRKFSCVESALAQTMPEVPWHLHQGEGSVFAWLWLQDLPISDLELYQELKKEGVIIVPGSFFFPGLQEEWTHKSECIRISLTASEAEIREGTSIIARVTERIYNSYYSP